MTRYMIAAFMAVCGMTAAVADTMTLSLEKCRDMSVNHSEQMAMSENSRRQAKLDYQIAGKAYLPKIDGSATALCMLPDIDMMGMKMSMKGTYMAGLQLIQPVYTGGKITNGRRLARVGMDVAEEQLRMTRMDVIEDADNSYWNYVAVRDKVKLMESYRAMIDTLYSQTQVAVELGLATDNDLLRIEAKRSEIAYQQQKVANGVDLCRLAICSAIGVDPDTEILPLDSVVEVKAPGLLDYDNSARPELALLEKKVEAAKYQVNMTRADFLPTVGLSLGYNYYGNIKLKSMVDVGGGNYMPMTQEFRDGIGMGLLSVSIPLFHWGEGMKKVKKAKLEVENALLERQQTGRLLDLQTRQAGKNLEDGWTMISSAKTALVQAEENLRVMQIRYEEGMSPLTDMLDAQSQWQQAKSNVIESLTQYRIYQTQWLRATGRLE